jgi:hypothetical protein
MDQVREIGRSYTVELPILSNTNSKFSFGDNETALDNVLVTGISVLPSLIGKSPAGRALLQNGDILKGFITLADKSKKEYNKSMPLELFLRTDSIIHIKPKLISIRNCYVDLPLIGEVVIPAGPPAGLAIVFTIFFDPYDPKIHKINSIGELESNRY